MGEGVGDGARVAVSVKVAVGDGWKMAGVGICVGEGWLPQDAHRVRRHMIAAPAERDRER